MSEQGCPNCGAPYRRTASTDEDLTGEVSLPTETYAQVCYQTRLTKEKYFGFTLYFHPETLYALEKREENADDVDGEWRRVRLFATEATAADEREKRERVRDVEHRVREVPLSDGQR
ncbi:hypothetical protein SAMN04487948_12820 [Halogranum amylolyticum]|uniref:Uncharacterized protein n=1 Tax=Halogranum amylolyticum TaxID=660520 RepID=A0A1H8WE63_9EURY|nr:hypothetical protein [Halogranum amylolyticum]SEP25950.1 hypothetical protein SAMN04487948_12820 [Halogranum amylolyticum]